MQEYSLRKAGRIRACRRWCFSLSGRREKKISIRGKDTTEEKAAGEREKLRIEKKGKQNMSIVKESVLKSGWNKHRSVYLGWTVSGGRGGLIRWGKRKDGPTTIVKERDAGKFLTKEV